MIIRTEQPHTSVYLNQLQLIAAQKFLHMCQRAEIPGGGLKDPTEGRLGEAATASV